MCSNNHHNDGHIAVTIPAAIEILAMLIERSPEEVCRPPYVGVGRAGLGSSSIKSAIKSWPFTFTKPGDSLHLTSCKQ